MQQLKPNTTLQGGKYRIERVLGQGGFGNTYEGYNTFFDERVAIKEFFMQGLNDRDKDSGSVSVSIERNIEQFQEQREKFKKEAQRIRKLNNPHIVRVYDLFEENGTTYYVMDFIDGESLAERLKRTGVPMAEKEVERILPQILDALMTVHDAGIWHLDLKPANIMIDKSGNVKLIDFGASKQLNTQKGGATTSTAISYTNGYAPREQMEQNYDKFGPWTDLYALGATLYTLLTNKRPPLPTDIDDDNSKDKHLALPLPNEVSRGMQYIILWMMSTNRNNRPQNVEEIAKQLPSNSSDNVHKDLTINDKEFNEINEETIVVANDADDKKTDRKDNIEKKETTQTDKTISSIDNKSSKEKNDSNTIKLLLAILFSLILVISIYFLSQFNNSGSYEQTYPGTDSLVEAVDSVVEVIDYDYNSPLGKCKFTGSFDENKKPHGKGKATFSDGRFYEGMFVNGNLSGGDAIFRYPNGDEFRGTFKNNAFYDGTYTIAEDGSYFTGTFKNGQPDKGIWYDKNGKKIE